MLPVLTIVHDPLALVPTRRCNVKLKQKNSLRPQRLAIPKAVVNDAHAALRARHLQPSVLALQAPIRQRHYACYEVSEQPKSSNASPNADGHHGNSETDHAIRNCRQKHKQVNESPNLAAAA